MPRRTARQSRRQQSPPQQIEAVSITRLNSGYGLLSEVRRTSLRHAVISANDPKADIRCGLTALV
jgi:hypothetical protein